MSYLDSLEIYRLKKYYGKHFYSMFSSWYLTAVGYVDANKRRYISSNLGSASYENIPFLNTTDGNVTWSPGQLTVVSTSSEDTPNGNGASKIMLEGINSRNKRTRELVTLDGNNEVKTVVKFRFLNKAYVYQSGNGASVNNFNLGTIDISTGTTTASNSLTVPWATIIRGEGYASIGGYGLQRGEMILITKVKINCSADVSGQFTMWSTNREVIPGSNTVEVPYAAATSVFNSRLGGEIIFDEPYLIREGTVFFTVDKLTSKSLVSIEACGLKTDGEYEYEKLENKNITYYAGYRPKLRDASGKEIQEERIEDRKANTKRALRRKNFFTMTGNLKKDNGVR